MKKTAGIFLLCCIMASVTCRAVTVRADEKNELKKEKVYVATDAGVGSVSLGWSPSEKAAKYRILSSDTIKGGYKCIKTVKSKKTGYTVNVTPDKGHYYKVRPVFILSDGTKINGKKSDAVYARSFEAAPAITAEHVKKGNKISWTPSSFYDGYIIYAAYDDTEEYVDIKILKKRTKKQFVDKYAEPGTDVSYKICGYYKVGGEYIEGPFSEPVSFNADGTITVGAKVAEPDIIEDTAVSGNTVSGDSVSGNAVSGNAVSGDSVSANNITESSSIKFNTRTVLLGVGKSAAISATSETVEGKPVYSVIDKTVAKVDENGVVTGVGPGSTKVIAEIGGEKATVVVTVTDCDINGIDISKWQGDDVDFEKIKIGGVSFVMMRAAYHLTKDTRFEKYYEGATAAGLKRGVYCYSMAKSVSAARKEAENVIEILDGRQLDYPIAMDLEDATQLKGLTNADRTDMVLAFKNRVEAAGYSFVLYANLNWLNSYVDGSRLSDVNIWIARYRTQSYGHGYTGQGNVVMWQYASNGLVDGILDVKGKYISIDMNVCYTTEFPITYDPSWDPASEDATENGGGTDGTENTDNTGGDGGSGTSDNTEGTDNTVNTDNTGSTDNTDTSGTAGD